MVGLDAWNGDDVPFRGKDDGERDGLEITHSVEDEIHRLVSAPDGRPWWMEPKTEADVSPEVAQEQAALYEWASKHVGIEYTEAQKEQAKGRIRRAPAAGSAYGGLVPRKAGEFHHHFTSKLPMTQCVHCGGTVYEPCRGPQADEWEERMQERRSLKERLFFLAYGISEVGHEEAARQMAEFNAETLRLFPDRFREPTPEEVKAREEFDRMRNGHIRQETEGRFTEPIPGDERLNEQIRAAKEAAWDEGREAEAEAHFADGGYGNVQHPENPYRKADDE